ncbi:MAG: hypothetical protein IT443_01375 [Phycisphaeraceae bacterium]|nr:hypothetical protein [Phycisphaeraceae bacterium]
MADSSLLLRMLEPAVRPTGSPAPSPRQLPGVSAQELASPIEQRSFDSLLAEARYQSSAVSGGTGGGAGGDAALSAQGDFSEAAAKSPQASPLADLSSFNSIENPSVRNLRTGGQLSTAS